MLVARARRPLHLRPARQGTAEGPADGVLGPASSSRPSLLFVFQMGGRLRLPRLLDPPRRDVRHHHGVQRLVPDLARRSARSSRPPRTAPPPDPAVVALAGLRSKHNTYMSVPLLFMMVAQHSTWAASPDHARRDRAGRAGRSSTTSTIAPRRFRGSRRRALRALFIVLRARTRVRARRRSPLPDPAPTPTPLDHTTTGTIEGRRAFRRRAAAAAHHPGRRATRPARRPIPTGSPFATSARRTAASRDAFVYIAAGLEDRVFAVPDTRS